MKLVIVSDAAAPQVNGVVRTLETTISVLERQGWEVLLIHPGMFPTFPLPGYGEIRVPVSTKGLAKMLVDFNPTYVHIATEGRLGWAARRLCMRWDWRFTTAYHTDFPNYLRSHYGIPVETSYKAIRRFHNAAAMTMVATPTIEHELRSHGIPNICRWGRGVDTKVFTPRTDGTPDISNPLLLYVGRVSKEKNLEAFFKLDRPCRKVVVGNGPMLAEYQRANPTVSFLGALAGEELAEAYRSADCFVFPSRTDTFGLVIIEAMACGTPVAAYEVQGPIDILSPESGAMSCCLMESVRDALELDRAKVALKGQSFTWEVATYQFCSGLVKRQAKAR